METTSVGGSSYRKQEAIKVSFVTHRPDALQALRERCHSSPAFRRLLETAAHDLVRRGRPKPVLTGSSPKRSGCSRKPFTLSATSAVPRCQKGLWQPGAT